MKIFFIFSLAIHSLIGLLLYRIFYPIALTHPSSNSIVSLSFFPLIHKPDRFELAKKAPLSQGKQPQRILPRPFLRNDTNQPKSLLNRKTQAQNNQHQNEKFVNKKTLFSPPQENPSLDHAFQKKIDPLFDELRKAIEEEIEYPAEARVAHQAGRVMVGFTLKEDGTVNNIQIIQSSTFKALDQAAIESVQRINQLKRFKHSRNDEGGPDWEITLPIEFKGE